MGKKNIKKSLKRDEPMDQYTTLGIADPARVFGGGKKEEVLFRALSMAIRDKLPYLVIGFGSNLLVSDDEFIKSVFKRNKYVLLEAWFEFKKEDSY